MNESTQSKLAELRKRLFFTLSVLGIFRVATQVPTPGINSSALASFFQNSGNTALQIFNQFTGGALERYSVLALGIMPYITSSIIFSLLVVSFPKLAEIQKEADGQKRISRWTRYATVILCAIQGYGLAVMMENLTGGPGALPIVTDPGMSFRLLTIASMTAGTMFVMWLGEQITERGIGNGISLIIFAGIAAGIPSGLNNTLKLYNKGELSGMTLLIVAAVIIVSFWIIIFFEKAFRKVPVQYAKRVVNNRVFGGQTSHLPIKVNVSGVMPPIFASALLSFPNTVLQMLPADWQGSKFFLESIQQSLQPGNTLFNVLFAGFIVFFAYFYSTIQFKTKDISEMLQKNGGFIPGIRPGEKTVEFLEHVLSRLTLVGAIYITAICLLPMALANYAKVPFYFGGTSLLILVGVSIDTMAQAETFLISQRYDKIYKVKGKFSGPRRF